MASEYYPEVEVFVTAFGCQMTLLSEAMDRTAASLTDFAQSLQWLDTLARIEAEERGDSRKGADNERGLQPNESRV